MPAYQMLILALMGVFLAGIPSCSGGEVQEEQFNNNSSGADRDHTSVHKEDTLHIEPSAIEDSIRK